MRTHKLFKFNFNSPLKQKQKQKKNTKHGSADFLSFYIFILNFYSRSFQVIFFLKTLKIENLENTLHCI